MASPATDLAAWHGRVVEEILDPDRPIVDPHHHLWHDRGLMPAYLLEQRVEKRGVTFVHAEGADAQNGQRIFEEECVDCHSTRSGDGEAPWLGGGGFQQTYSDALIGHTIKYGRDDTLMIAYGEDADGDYSDGQISDVVAYIRTLR